MIAVCPKCEARYRIERERLAPEGVRLRCARCQGVFRVRPPPGMAEATRAPVSPRASEPSAAQVPAAKAPERRSEQAPAATDRQARRGGETAQAQERRVLVALPDVDLAKQTAELLASHGLAAAIVHDGVEAMLEIQRQLPRAVVLSATLPRMYGFQICEIVKRNESLRSTYVVLAGAVHHRDRYRRPARDLHGADAYLEEPDLPEGLMPLLARAKILREGAHVPTPGERPAPPLAAAPPPAPTETSAAAPKAPAPDPVAPPDDELAEARRRAERLARIIVSDIVLYNQAKFEDAVSRGSVQRDMVPELDEGRALFRERVDPRVRAERDHLMEELLRVASQRAAG